MIASLNGHAAESMAGLVNRMFPVDSGKIEFRALRKRPDSTSEARSITRRRADLPELIEWARARNEEGWNVYVCLNPVGDDHPDGRAASNEHVTWRTGLVFDVDSIRADTDAPATDEEAAAAIEGGRKVARFLTAWFGFPAPILVATGNGCQLLYAIDLPNDTETAELVRDFLRAVAEMLAQILDGCEIDLSVHNASRLVRLAGSINFKPHADEGRPNRPAEILSVPESMDPATPDLLRDAIACARELRAEKAAEAAPERSKESSGESSSEPFEEKYIRAALAKECDKIASARQGQRHNQARSSAVAMGGFRHLKAVPDSDIEGALVAAATEAGLPEPEAKAVVSWGLAIGDAPGKRRSVPEPKVKPGGKAEPEPTDDGPKTQDATQIIIAYFRERYSPKFRRGNTVVCEDGETITMGGSAGLPTSVIVARLAAATNAPRHKGGVDFDRLPTFFKTWAPVAWGDLFASLPSEDQAELGADAPAREEFRRLVREALLAEVVLGDIIGHGGVTQTERRSLIGWCQRFAKVGPWRSIRSKRCWCKLIDKGEGEVELAVAIRHELLAQVGADRRLREIGANAFTRRAQRYGVGASPRDDRPHGQRALILAPDFLADLTTESVGDDPEG